MRPRLRHLRVRPPRVMMTRGGGIRGRVPKTVIGEPRDKAVSPLKYIRHPPPVHDIEGRASTFYLPHVSTVELPSYLVSCTPSPTSGSRRSRTNTAKRKIPTVPTRLRLARPPAIRAGVPMMRLGTVPANRPRAATMWSRSRPSTATTRERTARSPSRAGECLKVALASTLTLQCDHF